MFIFILVRQTPYSQTLPAIAQFMTLRTVIRTFILITIVIVGLWIIRMGTIYVLVFGMFGESEQGLNDADKTYNLFPVRHLPILTPLIILTYQTVKHRLWTTDRGKMISNIIIGLVGLVTYILIEQSDIMSS